MEKEIFEDGLLKQILNVEEKLKEIYAEKEKLTQLLLNTVENGVIIRQNEDKTWTRIKAVDNIEALKNGNYWKMVKVEPFSIKIDFLKTMPKELKGE